MYAHEVRIDWWSGGPRNPMPRTIANHNLSWLFEKTVEVEVDNVTRHQSTPYAPQSGSRSGKCPIGNICIVVLGKVRVAGYTIQRRQVSVPPGIQDCQDGQR